MQVVGIETKPCLLYKMTQLVSPVRSRTGVCIFLATSLVYLSKVKATPLSGHKGIDLDTAVKSQDSYT